MPQFTAVRYATVGATTSGAGIAAWANPANIVSDNAVNASVTVDATGGLTSGVLSGEDFSVLTENGGTIPTGATIINVTLTVELTHSVTDSLTANAATRTWRIRRGTGGAAVNEQSATQADNTTSGLITVTATTGGTQAAPQTTFTRADLLNSETTNQLRGEMLVSMPTGALNASTCLTDYMRVVVEWIKYETRTGAVLSAGTASGAKKVQATKAMTVRASGVTSGPKKAQVTKAMTVQAGSVASGVRKVQRTVAGQIQATENLSGVRKTQRSATGTTTVGSVLTGPKKVQVTKVGTVFAAGFLQGSKTVQVTKAVLIQATANLSGLRRTQRSATGQVTATSNLSGSRKTQRSAAGTLTAGGRFSATYGLYTFGLSGYTYNATGSAVKSGVRVDVFRTSDMVFMASTTSDVNGYFAIGLVSGPATYFLRGHIVGTPHLVDTSDEELTVIETLIQGSG